MAPRFDDFRSAIRAAWNDGSIRAGIDDWHHSKFAREQASVHYEREEVRTEQAMPGRSIDEILSALDGFRDDRVARAVKQGDPAGGLSSLEIAQRASEQLQAERAPTIVPSEAPAVVVPAYDGTPIDRDRERFLDVLMHRALADPAGFDAAEYYLLAGETAEESWQRLAPQRELEREMRGYHEAMKRDEIALALRLGVAKADVADGLIGVARVRKVEGDRWEPAADGVSMFVTPVRLSPGAPSPYHIESPQPNAEVRVGEITDIVAWRPKPEDRWLLRTGEAAALGAAPYRLSDEEPRALAIRTGPLDWLRHRGDGIVLLTRDREEQRMVLLNAEKVVVESPRLRDQIRAVAAVARILVEAPPRVVEAPNVVELRVRAPGIRQ
jgi:hypothetical protein